MAVKFRTTTQGFTNFWTQLKDIASTKSLYNAADYEALTSSQKEQYLSMLYANNDALAQRMPEEYNNEYGDTQTRFALLSAVNAKYTAEKNASNPEYAQQLADAVNKQLDAQLSSDIDKDKNWVDWLVKNRYNGSYASFAADYSGDNAKKYEDALTEMVPAEYELNEQSFKEGVSNVVDTQNAIRLEHETAQSEAYKNTLKYVKEKINANAEKEAYENASTLTKILNTTWQVPTLWAAELVEIVEGVGDALLTVGAAVEEIFSDTSVIRGAIEYDWWAPETWLGVATSESYLNKYADENIASWIYEIGINIVDMAPLAIPGIGQAIYYASAFGKSVESNLQSGYTFGESFTSAIGSTAIEIGTEKLSGSKFFGGGVFKKWEKIGGKNLGWKIFHDSFGEGLEEVISGIGSDLWHGMITGDYTLDTSEGWAQIGKSFMIGGLVGGIMTAGNAGLTSHVASKTAVRLKNADGKIINLPLAKAAVISDFVQRTGKKIEAGKTVSNRTRERFDILKNMKVVETDMAEQIIKAVEKSAKGKDIRREELLPTEARVKLVENYYAENVQPKISRKLRLEELVKESMRNKKAGDTTSSEPDKKLSFAEEAEKLRKASEKPATDNSTYEFTEENGPIKDYAAFMHEMLDKEDLDRLQKDFQISGAMTLGKLVKMFGEDALTSGIKLWAQYQDKTINEVVELLQLGSDNSAFTVSTDTDNTALSKHFNGAEFVMVDVKAGTEVSDKYKAITETLKATKSALKNITKPQIKLFLTTGETVATSFFVDNVMYINAAWLAETDVGRIKDIIIAKHCVQDAMITLDTVDEYQSTRQLLMEAIRKIDNPNRSTDIMLQEMAFIMFFQKDNILLRQVLSYSPDKTKAVIEYFSALRQNYASRHVQNAAGAILSNMVLAAEDIFDTGEEPDPGKTLPEDKTESVKDIIDAYKEHEFRAFPFITGKNGIPYNAAKVQAMYLYMQKTYGFNVELDLTQKINWIKELTNPKNYDGDGFKRLVEELNKYRHIKSTTGYTRSTVPTNKTLGELLNYYLDNICGLMVFSNGVIVESELTTRVFNIEALQATAEELALKTGAKREPYGKVGDYLQKDMKALLPAEIQEIPVYLAADSNSDSSAQIVGNPNTDMALLINIAEAKRIHENTVTAGGKCLQLSLDGDLQTNSDGSFVIQNNTMEISTLAYVIGHEIGHCIGMYTGFNGTFCETDIANTYGEILSKADSSQRHKFIESVVSWLMDGDTVKPSMLDFALRLGMRKADIDKSNDAAEAKIKTFVKKLDKIITDKLTAKQISKLLEPLAVHLYFTGFANEMFANGRVESVARTDVIHSELFKYTVADIKISGTRLITNSNLYFIDILNGVELPTITDENFLSDWLDEIQNNPENVGRRLLENAQNISELASELNVKFAAELIDPNFWKRKVASKPKNRAATKSKLIDAVEHKFDVTYDSINKEFTPGFVSKNLRETYDLVPKKGETFAAIAFNNGNLINAKNHVAFNEDSGIKSAVVYVPKTKGRKPTITIRLNSDSKILLGDGFVNIDGLKVPYTDGTKVNFVAGGKVFSNLKTAKLYLKTTPTQAKDATFESVFERVIEQANTTGRQAKYSEDTIYVTTDGSIYNLDVNMQDWRGYASMILKTDADVDKLFGMADTKSYTDENISAPLARLLDDKRVVRLYRDGKKWKAYGTPNKLQENYIRELNAEFMSELPYKTIIANRKLFVNTSNDKPVVKIHSPEWQDENFREVDWKINNWYKTVCDIITLYNINSFDDFDALGFSKDFIDKLKSGMSLGEQVFLDYIRDSSNTDYSKNILIENCPTSEKSGDWKNNPHIKTIEQAKEYWKLATIYGPIMPTYLDSAGNVVPIIYNDILDLSAAMAKAESDPSNVPVLEQRVINAERYAAALGDEIFIQILNKDASTGLGLDKNSFDNIFGYIRQYYESIVNSGKYQEDTGIEMEDDDGHTMFKGESEEIPEEFKKINDKGPLDNIFLGFVKEIKQAKEISDPVERTEMLEEILEWTNDPIYSEYENMPAIRNSILQELEGTDQVTQRGRELTNLKRRIEKFKKMEENTPEQLRERRRLIRLYEAVKNTKLEKLNEGDADYYSKYLELLKGVGTYAVNMNQAFAHFYKKAYKVRKDIADKERFDYQIEKLRELRNAILRTDMEYPGWYENYNSLLQMAKDWIDGKKETQGKTFAAVRTDIINFVNRFEEDAEFRQSIAEREKVSDYIFAKQIRGAKLFKSDLGRFKNIPENIKDISSFPKDAREQYDRFATGKAPVRLLANILSNPNAMTKLVKTWGMDYVYNLEKLYNSLTLPVPGTGVQKARKDFWEDLYNDLELDEELRTEADATVQAITDKLKKPDAEETKKTVQQYQRENYSRYTNFITTIANRQYDYLVAGKEVSDEQRKTAIETAANEIKEYLWPSEKRYYTVRLDVSNLPEDITNNVIARFSSIDRKRKENAVFKVHDKSGKLQYVEFLSKYSPFSERVSPSDVRSIKPNRGNFDLARAGQPIPTEPENKKKRKKKADGYHNKYYEQRRVLYNYWMSLREQFKKGIEARFRYKELPQDDSEKTYNLIETSMSTKDLTEEQEIHILDSISRRIKSQVTNMYFTKFLNSDASTLDLFNRQILDLFKAGPSRWPRELQFIFNRHRSPSRDEIRRGILLDRSVTELANDERVRKEIADFALDELHKLFDKGLDGASDELLLNPEIAKTIKLIDERLKTYRSIIEASTELFEPKLDKTDGKIKFVLSSDVHKYWIEPILKDTVNTLMPHMPLDDSTRTIIKPVDIYHLGGSRQYKTVKAILYAYYSLMDNPKTDRSIDKFKNDIGVALEYGQIDKTIPGTKKKERVSIDVPKEYIEPWWDPEKQVDVDAELAPVFDAKLTDMSVTAAEAQKAFENFKKHLVLEDEITNAVLRETDTVEELSKAEKLRQIRIAWNKRTVRNSSITIVSSTPYNIIFDTDTNTFKNIETDATVSEDDVDFRLLPDDSIKAYIDYYTEIGLKEGWLSESRAGNIIDPTNKKIVAYGEKPIGSGMPSEEDFEDAPSDEDFEDAPSEEDFEDAPSDEDFEDAPSEEDFEDATDYSGISKFIEDDMTFEPLDIVSEPMNEERQPKGFWENIKPENRYYQVKRGLSSNTTKILDYQPRKWSSDGIFNTAEFLEDNDEYIKRFINDKKDVEAFVAKIESNPLLPINSPQEFIIFALLNKISHLATVTVKDSNLSDRAEALVKQLASRAGRTLGMVKAFGTTSVDQLVKICSKMLNLNDEEQQLLADCATVQQNAIAVGNYTRASEAFDEVLKVLKKHQDELPVSMNIFAKELTPEERTARWHNIAERVTSWRYFAMLGAPTTFFAKNLASNVIITGMDNAAEAIGNAIVKKTGNTRFETNYAFVDTVIEQALATGKNLKLLSIAEVRAIVEQTITDQTDRKHVDINKLTKVLNDFITTRYKVQKVMPTAGQVASKANEWLRKQFYQYKLDKKPSDRAKRLMELKLVANGLLSGLMDDSVSKYDRGYDIKIGKLREIVLNKDTTLDEISEADAAILADALRSDSPFGSNPNNLLNKYYRFIFRSMEWGDKKFIEPKIKKTVAALIESNMTEAEMTALENGDKAALAKFNEFVQYAVDDAMKTYFRSNSDFQKKVMRLFNGHPVAQLIFGTLMPFPRMALNTMSTVLSYSPVGFIKALIMSHNNQDAFSQLKVSKELGKAVTGSVALAVGAALAACGWLDFDDDDEYAGVQLIIGNKIRLALDDLMPSAMPLVIGATMTNHWTEGIWSVVYNGGDVLLDSTLLGEAIEIFGGNKQSTDVVIDTFSSFVNQFMPAVFRHTARAIDPTSKKYSSNKGIKIMQRLAASLPIASYLVPAKIDPYTGESIYQNIGHDKGWINEEKFHFGWANVLSFINAFAPTKITLDAGSNVENESKTVGAPTTGPSKTYTIDGIEYTIPEELYKDYQILRAKLYSQYAQSVINTSRYQNMSIEQKRAKLKQLQTKATQEARKQLKIGK